jgi:hypothetical protein
MITLREIADPERVARIVDDRRTPAWTRAALRNPPIDGVDTYMWMTRTSAGARASQVRTALLKEEPWAPVVENEIQKPASWKEVTRAVKAGRRFVSSEVRGVIQDSRVDHARQLLLKEALEPIVERKLSRVALAYRPGLPPHESFIQTQGEIRERGLKSAYVVDIFHCFDQVPWDLLDRALNRHLGSHVEANVLDQVKHLYRVDVFDRSGRKVQRDRGVPQGLVLAPLLLNLYLRDFDLIVSRGLANLGCIVRRYCDDILIAGPNQGALRTALGIVERELARLRLRVKPVTKTLRDLNNPKNAPVWLGFAFTETKTWVSRERIERKAAQLLQDIQRGRLDRAGVEAALNGLRAHYLHVLHPVDVERAVASIRKLLIPLHMTTIHPRRKEGIDRIRQQLKTRHPMGRTKPAPHRASTRHEIPFPVCPLEPGTQWGKGNAGPDPCNSSSIEREPTWTPTPGTPPGGSTFDTGTPSLSSPPHDGFAYAGEGAGDLADRGRVPQPAPLPIRVPSSNSGSSLASRGVHRPSSSPVPDQAGHRDGPPGNLDVAESHDTALALLVSVRPLGKRHGRLRLEYSDGTTRLQRFCASRASSASQIALAGYRTALRLMKPGVDHVLLGVTDSTISGYLDGRYVVRCPDTLLRWELLLKQIDGLACLSVSYEAGDGPGRVGDGSDASGRPPKVRGILHTRVPGR